MSELNVASGGLPRLKLILRNAAKDVYRTTMRATVYTVVTTLFLGGGHWVVLGLCCYTPLSFLMMRGNSGDSLKFLAMFHAITKQNCW